MTVEDQETKSIQNAISGVHVAILCLEEDLEEMVGPDKTFLNKLEELSDRYEGREPLLPVKT